MKYKRDLIIATSFLAFLLAIPLAMAKNVVRFSLDHPLHISGQTIKPGNYKITWVAHGPAADVTFLMHDKTVATVSGKMVEKDKKADYNTLITDTDKKGDVVLKEILLAGKKSVLVF